MEPRCGIALPALDGAPSPACNPQAARMNRVLDHIDAALAGPLGLEDLAAVGAYSPYHFHRRFLAWTGETPHAYVRRRRLEVAASRLRYDAAVPIARVARESGFGSPESFARAFRQHFGVSARIWRQRLQPEAAAGMPAGLTIALCPPLELAYMRKLGGYAAGIDAGWPALDAWAASAGLGRQARVGLGLDDPFITPAARCRYDLGVVVPAGWRATGSRLARRSVPGGWHACVPYSGPRAGVAAVWRALLHDWLPRSGLRIAHGPFFEFYAPDALPRPDATLRCELRMPVRR